MERSLIRAVLDAVRNSGQMLVLGEPGSGKTTLLRYLALQHATALITGSEPVAPELGVPRFPVYVRIGDFARPSGQAASARFCPTTSRARNAPPARWPTCSTASLLAASASCCWTGLTRSRRQTTARRSWTRSPGW